QPQNPNAGRGQPHPQHPNTGRMGGQPQNPDPTVMRGQQPPQQNPDATVMRGRPQQPVDQTRMQNQQPGMDPTRVNPEHGHASRPDATLIAPRKPGPPSRPAGPQTRTHHQQQNRPAGGQPMPLGQQPGMPPITAASIAPNQPGAQGGGNQPRILKGRFLLEQVLGVGGMGIVYKAKDRLKIEAKDRDPYVAIKVLSEEFKSHPESFIALQRESRKSQRMAHPNTVKVYDFDRDGDIVFMTMEYLEGKDLDKLLRQYSTTGLPPDDAWLIVEGICSALSHAHKENIVHSDFKPGNVFVTTTGIAKVFDFGIARAVANVDRNDGKAIDKTVFDAGSLGALTPAYASLEMLQGKTPDVRDDIYALGCVIYELFAGTHPFGKMPADEAFKKGLKPKRIDGITKRQWRAVEKSLAFKREDRIATVDELHKELTVKYKPSYVVGFAGVIIVALLAVIFFLSTSKGPEIDVNSIQFQTEFNIYKRNITALLDNPTFTLGWEDDVWVEVERVTKFLQNNENEWLVETRTKIYQLYINKIAEIMREENLSRAKILIENAYRYTDDTRMLDIEKRRLAEALKRAEELKQKQIAHQVKEQQQNKEKYSEFNKALSNVQETLKCAGRLDMRDFAIAIGKLREIDMGKYAKMEDQLVGELASCITEVGKRNPENATEARKSALRLFNSHPTLVRLKITARDACDISLAGLGSSGSRSICRDKVRGFGQGPAMVVIPGAGNIKPFAIGKFEVSVGEMNLFCKTSKMCNVITGVDSSYPVTNIDIKAAKEYLKWLSDKTGQKYRLPSDDEWLHAANTTRRVLDSNRNCKLSSRGIQKGRELVKTTTGRQNSWGLVNYVGNAQEWVYGNGRRLTAMGGSFYDSMESCDTSTRNPHSGKPDDHTGFRILREIKDR
ncbi:MAG: protein kinase, partial [Gammaproteobacteria bacterium]|nr:protein kinase [Gammaproteobacteria bacterium]